jgi:hypothetical protein
MRVFTRYRFCNCSEGVGDGKSGQVNGKPGQLDDKDGHMDGKDGQIYKKRCLKSTTYITYSQAISLKDFLRVIFRDRVDFAVHHIKCGQSDSHA